MYIDRVVDDGVGWIWTMNGVLYPHSSVVIVGSGRGMGFFVHMRRRVGSGRGMV